MSQEGGSNSVAFELVGLPGLQRDGTDSETERFRDALWTRWQRGKPRKIGGYRAISPVVPGPVRGANLDSREALAHLHLFSDQAIVQLTFDHNGIGSGLIDRTPVGFPPNALYTWQSDSIFQVDGSGIGPNLVVTATPDLLAIDSDVKGPVYSGIIDDTPPLVVVSDNAGPVMVSGGCVVLQPFLFVYGSDGLIRNTEPNNINPDGWDVPGTPPSASAFCNSVNVAGTKIVKGLPLRGGGSSPAGLFWALDALIRVTLVGGVVVWKYDTVSSKTTILGKNGPIEYDGIYYWPGVDRFYFYNGVVQELPNSQNLNWFFDNINMKYRNKIWATAVPRFGEIWWFFPFGTATECTHAIIFNVREKTWYDTRLGRSAGVPASVFPRPVFAGVEGSVPSLKLFYTPTLGSFVLTDVVTGVTSGASGTVAVLGDGYINLSPAVGLFFPGETIKNTDGSSQGTLLTPQVEQQLDIVWQHEDGKDKIHLQTVTAIESYFETREFALTTGGPTQASPAGANKQVRLTRLEPDFILTGTLDLTVRGRAFPQSPQVDSGPYPIVQTTEHVDLREQRRSMSLKFRSNEIGGDFQMGNNAMLIEPGDERG